ncbi:MAG: TolC family protein [Chryseotalea sp.]
MKTLFIKVSFLSLLLLPFGGKAQDSLDVYIQEGLTNNLVLQQKNISLEKALLSLKIAEGMFFPSLSLLGNYTDGDGGRNISFPIGDLLNGVYSTLNNLTSTNNFPQVENVNTNFFPQEFYDVRARISAPIVNTDLIYNRNIQRKQQTLQEFEVVIYKRELVKNIKTAYYQYISANQAKKIYESALVRAQEGKRVNESLLANGKAVPAYLLRSQSEIEQTLAQIHAAAVQENNAQLYFNFLLNRPADSPITISISKEDALTQANRLTLTETLPSNREELQQVATGLSINQDIVKMKQSFWIPRLSGFADFGAQAENLRYSSQANYYLVGLQLEMPIFAGFTNRYKIKQAKLDVTSSNHQQELVRQQLNMATKIANNQVTVATQNLKSALKQEEAALSYQRLIEKGYKEGVNTFIETIDARNQLTTAQLQVVILSYQGLIAQAAYEREVASYQFK